MLYIENLLPFRHQACYNSRMEKLPHLNIEAEQELRKLASHIKTARMRRKITLADLAKRTGVSASTIWRLEDADPTVSLGTVMQVLGILGMVRGLSELIAPEHDVSQALEEVRSLRMGKRRAGKKVFDNSELQF